MKVVRWPKDAPVEGAFSKVEDVLNRGVIAPVATNEPLTGAKLAALEAGAGLPPSIPQGMRAISVKVNEVVGVAGFVVPGTRVDVMVTLKGRQNDDQSMTRIVCSNVQVLTAGTRYDQEKAKDGNAIPSTVVTLLVKPDDGERIALAAEEGQLMLSLRNPLDVEPTVTTGVKTAGLFGEAAPTPAKPRPAAAASRREAGCRARRRTAAGDAVPRGVAERRQALRGSREAVGRRKSVMRAHSTTFRRLVLCAPFLCASITGTAAQQPAPTAQAAAATAPRPEYERVVVTAGRSTIVTTRLQYHPDRDYGSRGR